MAIRCAGLPLSEERDLEFGEWAELRQEVRTAQRLTCALIAFFPLVLITGLVAIGMEYQTPGGTLTRPEIEFGGLLRGCLAFSASYGVVAGFLIWKSRLIARDLRSGRMLVFSGTIDSSTPDALQERLLRGKALRNEPDAGTQVIEAWAGSKRLFRVNEFVVKMLIRFKSPSVDGLEDEIDAPPTKVADSGRQGKTRRLTPSESGELRQSVLKCSFLLACAAMIEAASVGAGCLYLIERWLSPPGPVQITALAAGYAGALGLAFLWPHLQFVRGDLRAGTLLVHQVDGGADWFATGDVGHHQVSVESLPYTGRVWSIDGYPAQRRAGNQKVAKVN